MENALTRTRLNRLKYLLRQLDVRQGFSTGTLPFIPACGEGEFEEQADRGKQLLCTRESEDHGLRRARKATPIRKLEQRQAARQQATECHLTFDLSGPPKAGPLEGMVRHRWEDANQYALTGIHNS